MDKSHTLSKVLNWIFLLTSPYSAINQSLFNILLDGEIKSEKDENEKKFIEDYKKDLIDDGTLKT